MSPGSPALSTVAITTIAGAGKPAGVLDHLDEDERELERRADAQDGRAEGGDALAQRLVLPGRGGGLSLSELPLAQALGTGETVRAEEVYVLTGAASGR